MSAKFDFNDFLKQTRAVARMGSMTRVLGMIPGMGKVWNLVLKFVLFSCFPVGAIYALAGISICSQRGWNDIAGSCSCGCFPLLHVDVRYEKCSELYVAFVVYTLYGEKKLLINSPICVCKQVTPAQIREAEKSLKMMEGMIEAMTPGLLFSLPFKGIS